jgi:hypothetical protein
MYKLFINSGDIEMKKILIMAIGLAWITALSIVETKAFALQCVSQYQQFNDQTITTCN